MKKLAFLSFLLLVFISCEKDKVDPSIIAPIPPVNYFAAEYSNGNIDLSWTYSYTGQINYYILYYSPGGESTDTINAYESYYQVYHAMKDTNYLFNLKVVDKKGNCSAAEVLKVSTY